MAPGPVPTVGARRDGGPIGRRLQFGAEDRERVLVADVRMQYGVAVAAIRDMAVAEDLADGRPTSSSISSARVSRQVALRHSTAICSTWTCAGWMPPALSPSVAPMRHSCGSSNCLGMAPSEPLRLRDSLDTLVASTGDRHGRAVSTVTSSAAGRQGSRGACDVGRRAD